MLRSLTIPPAVTGDRQSDGSCAETGSSYPCFPREREVGELLRSQLNLFKRLQLPAFAAPLEMEVFLCRTQGVSSTQTHGLLKLVHL